MSRPATSASRRARGSSVVSRLAAKATSANNPNPTPPTQANAVRPVGTMKSTESSPQPSATDRPHRRASMNTPKTIAVSWSRPNRRSTTSEVPNTR